MAEIPIQYANPQGVILQNRPFQTGVRAPSQEELAEQQAQAERQRQLSTISKRREELQRAAQELEARRKALYERTDLRGKQKGAIEAKEINAPLSAIKGELFNLDVREQQLQGSISQEAAQRAMDVQEANRAASTKGGQAAQLVRGKSRDASGNLQESKSPVQSSLPGSVRENVEQQKAVTRAELNKRLYGAPTPEQNQTISQNLRGRGVTEYAALIGGSELFEAKKSDVKGLARPSTLRDSVPQTEYAVVAERRQEYKQFQQERSRMGAQRSQLKGSVTTPDGLIFTNIYKEKQRQSRINELAISSGILGSSNRSSSNLDGLGQNNETDSHPGRLGNIQEGSFTEELFGVVKDVARPIGKAAALTGSFQYYAITEKQARSKLAFERSLLGDVETYIGAAEILSIPASPFLGYVPGARAVFNVAVGVQIGIPVARIGNKLFEGDLPTRGELGRATGEVVLGVLPFVGEYVGGRLVRGSSSGRAGGFVPSEIPKGYRQEYIDLYRVSKGLPDVPVSVRNINLARIESVKGNRPAQLALQDFLRRGQGVVGGTAAIESVGVKLKRVPRDIDYYLEPGLMRGQMDVLESSLKSRGVKYLREGNAVVIGGEKVIEFVPMEVLKGNLATVSKLSFERNILKTPDGVRVANPYAQIRRKMLGGYEEGGKTGEKFARYSKDIPAFVQSSKRVLEGQLLAARELPIVSKQIAQFRAGRGLEFLSPYDELLERETAQIITRRYLRKNVVESPLNVLEDPTQRAIVDFAMKRGGYVGGSAAAYLQLPRGSFRAPQDIDLYFKNLNPKTVGKYSDELLGIIARTKGVPKNRVSDYFEVKRKGRSTIIKDKASGSDILDLKLRGDAPDKVVEVGGVRVRKLNQVESDKRSILKNVDVGEKKYAKAERDLQLIAEGKEKMTTVEFVNMRPNFFTAGFKYVDFSEFRFGKRGAYRLPELYLSQQGKPGRVVLTASRREEYTPPYARELPYNVARPMARNYALPYNISPPNKVYPVITPNKKSPPYIPPYRKKAPYGGVPIPAIYNLPKVSKYAEPYVSVPRKSYPVPVQKPYAYPRMAVPRNLLPKVSRLPRMKTKDESRVPGFDVFVRVGGVFRKVNKGALSESAALGLGARRVEGSSAATFKVLRSRGLARDGTDGFFGRRKNRFYQRLSKSGEVLNIEKTRFRINSPGELFEITRKGLDKLRGLF